MIFLFTGFLFLLSYSLESVAVQVMVGFHGFLHSCPWTHQRSTVKMLRSTYVNIGTASLLWGDFWPLPAYHKHHAPVALTMAVTQISISRLLLSLLTWFLIFSLSCLGGFLWSLSCRRQVGQAFPHAGLLPGSWEQSPDVMGQLFLCAGRSKHNTTHPPWRLRPSKPWRKWFSC